MPELVVDRDEILLGRLDAHLDAQIVRCTTTSHALAWHTTSRSFGRVKSERSQNVFGQRIEAERGEERLAELHHLLRVVLLLASFLSTSSDAWPLYGSTRS